MPDGLSPRPQTEGLTPEELAEHYIALGLAMHPDMAALIEELRLASGPRLLEIIVELQKEILKGKPKETQDTEYAEYTRFRVALARAVKAMQG